MKVQITVGEIAQRLASNTEAVCRWLLPKGATIAGEWCVGSIDGEEGKSLKVRLSGDKAGLWADFAGNEKGDLVDLIRCTKGIPIASAIKEAKDFLGLRDPESIIAQKTYAKPPRKPANVRKLEEQSKVMAYLTGERKLAKDVIAKFRIGDAGNEIAFPSFNSAAELVSVKYIGLERDERGKKTIRQEKGCAPALFGWQALKEGTRTVLISEGQIDAMTWHQQGFPALSVPNGVGDLDGWIDYEWENLQQFDQIFLSFDSDKPGQDAVQKVSKRLGNHRCLNVVLPKHKDANDALMDGMGFDYFSSAIAKAKPFRPKEIKSPNDFRAEVVEEFFPESGEKPGFAPETIGGELRFTPGQITIWTGISSHGKSNLLGQICLEGVVRNQRCAIASMEMPGRKTLMRMMRSATPKKIEVTTEFIEVTLNAMTGKLWIFDVLGNVALDKVIELMVYCTARFNVSFFVIDSLMKLDVNSDDNEAQRIALNKITQFAAQHLVHVHIVCHARKGADESQAPGKMDVKGSVDIINQCDNLVSVWRNKNKEAKIKANDMDEKQAFNTPDCICYICKNRETGEEGEVNLWFNRNRNRYVPKTPNGFPIELNLTPE